MPRRQSAATSSTNSPSFDSYNYDHQSPVTIFERPPVEQPEEEQGDEGIPSSPTSLSTDGSANDQATPTTTATNSTSSLLNYTNKLPNFGLLYSKSASATSYLTGKGSSTGGNQGKGSKKDH